MKQILTLALIGSFLVPATSAAVDTVSCSGKRAWQRDIVRQAVVSWFHGVPDPDHLVQLVQAEHGIVACSGAAQPRSLHTPTLQRGLDMTQFGAVLLANELEWRGLMPLPEEGLVGEFFRVERRAATDDALLQGDAR